MDDRYVPVDRDGSRAPEARTQFMMRCLLQSRHDAGVPSADDDGEQDVNVYLTQLLCAYSDPQYCLRVGGFISTYDTEVFERVESSRSHRFKYSVYKINADHLLMSIGIFQNPEGRAVGAQAVALRRGSDTFVGRGKTYYDFASTYSQRVFGRSSGVTGVLGKLSYGFENYVRLLGHLRAEYFDFVARLSEGELYHLQAAAQSEGIQALRDELLDRYSAWRHDPSDEARTRLLETVARLRRVDPDFKFDLLE
jgi:hypothetical protein